MIHSREVPYQGLFRTQDSTLKSLIKEEFHLLHRILWWWRCIAWLDQETKACTLIIQYHTNNETHHASFWMINWGSWDKYNSWKLTWTSRKSLAVQYIVKEIPEQTGVRTSYGIDFNIVCTEKSRTRSSIKDETWVDKLNFPLFISNKIWRWRSLCMKSINFIRPHQLLCCPIEENTDTIVVRDFQEVALLQHEHCLRWQSVPGYFLECQRNPFLVTVLAE